MTMRDILICTVGTSLIGNIEHSDNPKLKKLYEDKNAKGLAVELCGVSSDARLCGAEINSINSIIEKGHLTSKNLLKLLVSDTESGKFIGQVLKQYFGNARNRNRFEEVDCEVVEGLTDTDVYRFKTEGLRNLVRKIGDTALKYTSNRILINATGGYKAQISFAGMIGQALDIPVCYLFERFTEVIELPPQPVSFDLSFWLEYSDFFFDLDEIIDTGKKLELTDDRFAALVEHIEEDCKYLYTLSPTGQLFHESLQHHFRRQRDCLLPAPCAVPVGKRKIRFEDSNKGKHSGLENYLKKIIEVPYVKEIYTHYYNPNLTRKNTFRKSSKGIDSQIEGWFCNAGALTKFDIITTSVRISEQRACLIDLRERFPAPKARK